MERMLYFAACFLGWGVAVFLMTFVTRSLSNSTILACNLIGYCLVIAWFLPAAELRRPTWAHALAVLISALFVLANLAYYKLSAMGGQASVLAPLTGLYVVAAAGLGIVFLHEPLSVRKCLGVILAAVAILLLAAPDGQAAPTDEPGAGAFDTRRAFDALLAKQGRHCLETPDNGSLAWGEAYVMMGLATMYQATADTHYLDVLSEHADAVLARRDSVTGTKDYRGRSLPGWTAGGAYSIGEVRLNDKRGVPTLYLRSAMTGANDETVVTVTPGGQTNTFTLGVVNEKYKQADALADLSMDPNAENYAVARIRTSRLAQPFSAMRLHAEDLGSPSAGAARNPVPLTTVMTAERFLWPVHQGMIFEPMMLFVRLVNTTEALGRNGHYRAKAEAYAAAAEALFQVLEEGWRENAEGEGWYEVEKGAPVWMDGCDEPHNHYLAVGSAMLHLAAATPAPLWRQRVEKMANTLRNDMRYVPEGDLYVWPYWWSKGKVYRGWRPEEQVSRNTPGMTARQSTEDFSHGSIDINFAYQCYCAGIVFTSLDLRRLANTFMRNIVRHKDDAGLSFANAVDGTGGVGRYDLQGPAWPLLAELRPEILDVFRELRAQSPWNGYAVWLLQSANMNLTRSRLTAAGTAPDAH